MNDRRALRILFCHLFKDHKLCMIIMPAFLPAITGKMHIHLRHVLAGR